MAVARRDSGDASAPPVPAPLRRFLRFRDLPGPARTVVRDVLDGEGGFRERVVEQSAAALEGSALDPPSRLFLTRPEGWRSDLDLLVDDAAAADRRDEAAREEASAARRVEQLSATVERLRGELADAEAAAARLEDELDSERARRRAAEAAAAAATADADRSAGERATAVRQLSEARALAESRLAELRVAQASAAQAQEAQAQEVPQSQEPVQSVPAPEEVSAAAPPPVPPPVDQRAARAVARAAGAIAEAAQAVAAVGRELGEVAAVLAGPAGPEAPGVGAPDGERGPATRSAPGSRSAVGQGGPAAARGRTGAAPRRRARTQLRHGAVDGTAEATRQYLAAPDAVVLVDGYNVAMTAWPTMAAAPQRESLLTALTDLARRTGADVHVVFDGDADGGRPAVVAPLGVRVHFSPADVEADDVLLDMVEQVDPARPVVVVSSDRRVRDGARARGAATVSSAELLALWRS